MSAKKYSLYNPKNGHVTGIKPTYGPQKTICGEHIRLANMVNSGVEDPAFKDALLRQIDMLYDMGKRMGGKLKDYHNKFNVKGHWREEF